MSVAGGVSPRPAQRVITIAVPRATPNGVVAVGTGLVVALSAFVAGGGLRLGPTTRVLVVLLLGGAILSAVAAIRAPRTREHPLYGGFPLLAFTALGVFTAASVTWSLSPDGSWLEASRTLGYVAVFAGAIALVRMVPRAWQGMLLGLAGGCGVVALWALATKVWPHALAADETFARLRAPFDYWNSVGLTAATGILPLLWLGSRRHGRAFVSAFAAPGIAVLLIVLMLSYSRGGLIALGVALAFWFAVVPLRVAGIATLLLGVAGAAPVVWWAFVQDGLTTDRAPMAARIDAGHELGALVLLVFVVLLIAGLALQFARTHRAPPPRLRTALVATAIGIVVLLFVGSVTAAAASKGGLSGKIDEAWTELTDPNAQTPANTPDRLTATSSVRARYWNEAIKINELSPWVGVGAGAYTIARYRYRTNQLPVRHAHGYVLQTLADLGWIGLGLSLLTAFAWMASAARTTGMRRRDRGLPFDAERVGMLTLVPVVVLFVVHSALDWTWFVPSNVIAAALAAGWVAGRVPLRRRLLGPDTEPVPAREGTRFEAFKTSFRRRPAAVAAATILVLTGAAAAWSAAQPLRAEDASDQAFERLDRGDVNGAAAAATTATKRDPLSIDALYDLASIEQARNQDGAAEAALRRAVDLEPGNPETWRRLGRFQFFDLDQPEAALKSLRTALVLDPVSPTSRSDVLEVTQALRAEG